MSSSRLSLGGLVLLLVFAVSLPAADNKPLKVGIAANYPPIAFKKNGQLVGLEVELAARLSSKLNKKMEFIELPWADLISALQQGDIDIIMSGMSVTAERSKQVAFSEPYLRIGQMAIIRDDQVGRLTPVSKLFNGRYRVGVSANTTGERFVRNRVASAERQVFETNVQGIEALRAGKIDYFIHDAPTVWHLTGTYPLNKNLVGLYQPLTEEFLAWAVRIDDKALLNQLNQQLTHWRASGQLDSVIVKWIPVQIQQK